MLFLCTKGPLQYDLWNESVNRSQKLADIIPTFTFPACSHLVDAHHHEGLVAALLQMPPEVVGAALEDLSHVVHLDVEDLDVHLVERNGPQNLNYKISIFRTQLSSFYSPPKEGK